MRPPVFDPVVQVFAGHPRHVQVGQDDVIAARGEQFKRFLSTAYRVNMVAVQPQHDVKEVPCVGLIVNDQDAVGHGPPPIKHGGKARVTLTLDSFSRLRHWTKVQFGLAGWRLHNLIASTERPAMAARRP